MAFKLGMTVDLCMAYLYAHAGFDDLDLDLWSQWVDRGKRKSVLKYIGNYPSD